MSTDQETDYHEATPLQPIMVPKAAWTGLVEHLQVDAVHPKHHKHCTVLAVPEEIIMADDHLDLDHPPIAATQQQITDMGRLQTVATLLPTTGISDPVERTTRGVLVATITLATKRQALDIPPTMAELPRHMRSNKAGDLVHINNKARGEIISHFHVFLRLTHHIFIILTSLFFLSVICIATVLGYPPRNVLLDM